MTLSSSFTWGSDSTPCGPDSTSSSRHLVDHSFSSPRSTAEHGGARRSTPEPCPGTVNARVHPLRAQALVAVLPERRGPVPFAQVAALGHLFRAADTGGRGKTPSRSYGPVRPVVWWLLFWIYPYPLQWKSATALIPVCWAKSSSILKGGVELCSGPLFDDK